MIKTLEELKKSNKDDIELYNYIKNDFYSKKIKSEKDEKLIEIVYSESWLEFQYDLIGFVFDLFVEFYFLRDKKRKNIFKFIDYFSYNTKIYKKVGKNKYYLFIFNRNKT